MLLEVLKRIVALVALAFWLNLLAAVKFPYTNSQKSSYGAFEQVVHLSRTSFFGVTKNFICLCNFDKFALLTSAIHQSHRSCEAALRQQTCLQWW